MAGQTPNFSIPGLPSVDLSKLLGNIGNTPQSSSAKGTPGIQVKTEPGLLQPPRTLSTTPKPVPGFQVKSSPVKGLPPISRPSPSPGPSYRNILNVPPARTLSVNPVIPGSLAKARPSASIPPVSMVRPKTEPRPSSTPVPIDRTPRTPDQITAASTRCAYGRPVRHTQENDIATCLASLIVTNNPQDSLLSSYIPLVQIDYDSMKSTYNEYGRYGYLGDAHSALKCVAGQFPEYNNSTIGFSFFFNMTTDGTPHMVDSKGDPTRPLPTITYKQENSLANFAPVYIYLENANITKLGTTKIGATDSTRFLEYAKSRKILEYDADAPKRWYVGIWYNFREHQAMLRNVHRLKYATEYNPTTRNNRAQTFTDNVVDIYSNVLRQYMMKIQENIAVLGRLADDYASLPPNEAYKAMYCYLKRRSFVFIYSLNTDPSYFDLELVYVYHVSRLSDVKNGFLIIGTVKRGEVVARKNTVGKDNLTSYVELYVRETIDGSYNIEYRYIERKVNGERMIRNNDIFKFWTLYMRRMPGNTANDMVEAYGGLSEYHKRMKLEGRLNENTFAKFADVPSSVPKTRKTGDGSIRKFGDMPAPSSAVKKQKNTVSTLQKVQVSENPSMYYNPEGSPAPVAVPTYVSPSGQRPSATPGRPRTSISRRLINTPGL